MVMRVALAVVVLASAACSSGPPPEPLLLDGNRLTVDNRSADDWNDVTIRLNTYYQVSVRSIPAHGRFQVGLDSFTAGFGQRFDFRRMQVRDLRLSAKLPDGRPMEIKKEFAASGLAGALGGKR